MAILYSDRDADGLQSDARTTASQYARRIDCAESSRAGARAAAPQESAAPVSAPAPADDHDSRTRTGRADAR